jgi:tetratricopeptide (TPR) repeat protein
MRPPGPLLLGSITTFYCGKLNEYGFSNPSDENFADGSWICSHDDNIERLISHQLSTAPDQSTIKACDIFLYCIYKHKARQMTLGAVVEALRDDVSIYWKARSLQHIGLIAQKTGNHREATEFYNSARNTFLVGGYANRATHSLIDLAQLSYYGKEYAEAHRQSTQALAECQDFAGEYEKARSQQLLGQVALDLGKHSEASEFLTKALVSWERQKHMDRVGRVNVHLGRLEFNRGNVERGRSHFDAAAIIFSDRGDNHQMGWCSYYFGWQEMTVGNFPKAVDLQQKAEKFFLMANSTLAIAACMQEIGRIHYFQKEYSAAKTLLTKAKEKFDAIGSVEELTNAYYLAWVEFREGNSEEAKQILKEARQWFTEENGYLMAMYARSLGEFVFHEGDKDGAAVLFAQAQEAFEAVGFTWQKIDKEINEQDSDGWRWFHGGRH